MNARTFLYPISVVCLLLASQAYAANVIVEPIKLERTEHSVQAVGNAEAVKSVEIYPAVGDKVTGIFFKPGDHVQAEQILLTLDSRRQEASLQEAKIRLADALRTLTRLKESQVKGAVPQSDVDDAVTAHELAKVVVMQAKTELEDRHVLAPFSGVMGLTDVEVGDRITPQTMIATIDDIEQLFINFNAPENTIAMLKQTPSITVSPWQSDQQLDANIAELDSRINPQTRTLRTRVSINNEAGQFMPGMSFRVHIKVNGAQYAAVPEAALLWGATGPYVWKSVDNKATRVDVKIEQRLAGRLLVAGDLTQGEMLVVEGVQRLRPNQELTTNTPITNVQD